jgi:myo-inositol 2-dehydrogenase / D-chiro-inositol 1-dehydrogenase
MERRFFLMGPAIAAHSVFGQEAADRVPTAVIGTGNRGSYLLRGVLEQPNARVVAVCDNKPDRLDKAATAAAKDNPKAITDWRRIIDDKGIQAVFVATPPYLHTEMAVAAIQAGKHVYCEKPIGVNAKQVAQLLKAARSSSKVFTAGQQLRSMKQYMEAVRKIHEGAIGDVLWVKAQRHATEDLPHDGSSGDWYFDVSRSGGYLIEQSVHNLDLANWAINSHPTRAVGLGSIVFYKNQPPGRTIYDTGSITYDYPNGVKMSFTQMVFHPRNLPSGGQYIYVYGTKGAVDLMGGTNVYSHDSNVQPSVLVPKEKESEHAHITRFYDAVTKGTKSPADITIGATAALTAILGHEAMSQEKVVTWKDLGVEV